MRDAPTGGPALAPIAQAVAYHRDPLGVLRRLRARHGPVFTLRFPLKDPVTFIALPSALSLVLHADPRHAHAGAARRVILPQASDRSPFGGDGQAHAASRARMWPGFAPERIRTIEPAIAVLTEEHMRLWPSGRPFRLLEVMRTLCTDITVHLVLGIADGPRRRELVAAIRRMLTTPGNLPLPLPGNHDGPAGIVGRLGERLFQQRSAGVRRLLADELSHRRARDDAGEDVLGAILSSPSPPADDQIIDELLIVLMAAQEPPAIALTNVVYELAGRATLAEQFRAVPEAREAIIAEVMRLRPSASAALRKLTEPMRLDGYVLPTGSVVAAPSPLLHRDPHAFPDPDAFRAERFESGVPDGAPYFPFGGGARRCLGEHLARAEFRAVLPTVLSLRFTRVWPREERMVVRATVLVPHRSALVQAHPR